MCKIEVMSGPTASRRSRSSPKIIICFLPTSSGKVVWPIKQPKVFLAMNLVNMSDAVPAIPAMVFSDPLELNNWPKAILIQGLRLAAIKRSTIFSLDRTAAAVMISANSPNSLVSMRIAWVSWSPAGPKNASSLAPPNIRKFLFITVASWRAVSASLLSRKKSMGLHTSDSGNPGAKTCTSYPFDLA